MYINQTPLKVVFKNFFRSRTVNLSVASIKCFLPNAEIYCLNLYVKGPSDYDNQPILDIHSHRTFYRPTRFHGLGGAVGNPLNNLFFSEGYNLIQKEFAAIDDKVLMLCEDQFFTTGQLLNEVCNNEFDLAYCPWTPENVNGSLLCIRPSRLSGLFPIPETSEFSVEKVFRRHLVDRYDKAKTHKISVRKEIDYGGDGFYTNSADEIEAALKSKNII